jgi:hypothetical protein
MYCCDVFHHIITADLNLWWNGGEVVTCSRNILPVVVYLVASIYQNAFSQLVAVSQLVGFQPFRTF